MHSAPTPTPAPAVATTVPGPAEVDARLPQARAAEDETRSTAAGAYEVQTDERWRISRTGADLDQLAETESLFALSNCWLGWRGNLDEGQPYGMPGSYLSGFHETHELTYPESGYAFPEQSDTVISAPNAALIRLWVDGEPLDLRTGEVREHERVLDLRAGVVERHTEWVSPGGQAVRVRSTRLVSLVHRAVAAVRYEVEALDAPVPVRISSDLLANEEVPPRSDDPRAATVISEPLAAERQDVDGVRGTLVHLSLIHI